jgi:hypothetical protein
MKNKRELVDKYRALLRQAQKVADILEINRQLEAVVSELESLEGQMKYLNDQIALSTLELRLSQNLTPTQQIRKSFFSELQYNLSAGWSSFRGVVLWFFSLWPFLILLLAGWVIVRKVRRR